MVGNTGGRNTVRVLERMNISVLFGIPGIHNLSIYEGCQETGKMSPLKAGKWDRENVTPCNHLKTERPPLGGHSEKSG
jgi:hypothetical protein